MALLRRGSHLKDTNEDAPVSLERRRSEFASKISTPLSHRLHLGQPTQVDETEITGDCKEINRDSRGLFLLAQTCCPDSGDVHTARDRLERIKWR